MGKTVQNQSNKNKQIETHHLIDRSNGVGGGRRFRILWRGAVIDNPQFPLGTFQWYTRRGLKRQTLAVSSRCGTD